MVVWWREKERGICRYRIRNSLIYRTVELKNAGGRRHKPSSENHIAAAIVVAPEEQTGTRCEQ